MASDPHYRVVGLTREEGGRWITVHPPYDTTPDSLATAKANTYLARVSDEFSMSRLAKLPGLGVPFHALRMEDGAVWDAQNGWRPIEQWFTTPQEDGA